MRRSDVLLWVTCALSMGGCLERDAATVGPEIGFGQRVEIAGGSVSEVDVMFVIDNSGSMREEQDNLAVQIPALVRALVAPPDRDDDGRPDWNPVELLRIGIVTTDVGIGNVVIKGSHCAPNGEDGRLRGGVFEWRTGDDPDLFAGRIEATVDGLGLEGCAFEQQLEAAARAMTHADEYGFPATDRLFALIVVSDEEDCSVDDDDRFFEAIDSSAYNVHCTRNEGSLTPVPELLERIRGDRDPDDFLYAAITGVPRDLPASATPDEILAHDDMRYRESLEGKQWFLEHVCEYTPPGGESLGNAAPARRLVELGALVEDAVLTTICTDDFGPAIQTIAERIGARVPGVCLARALPSEGGVVPCTVQVTLPEDERCEDYDGYEARTVEGREVCDVRQVDEGSERGGFYYDPDLEGCPQLAFSRDEARPPIGSEVVAECFFPVLLPDGVQCARSSQCESGYCDPIDDVCAQP